MQGWWRQEEEVSTCVCGSSLSVCVAVQTLSSDSKTIHPDPDTDTHTHTNTDAGTTSYRPSVYTWAMHTGLSSAHAVWKVTASCRLQT